MLPEDNERYADELDRAAMLSDAHNTACIEKSQRAVQPEQEKVIGDDGEWHWPVTECKDCGQPIPGGRLELGKVRCVKCQSDREGTHLGRRR